MLGVSDITKPYTLSCTQVSELLELRREVEDLQVDLPKELRRIDEVGPYTHIRLPVVQTTLYILVPVWSLHVQTFVCIGCLSVCI